MKRVWAKLNGAEKVFTGVIAVGTVIGLAFGAWFAVTAAIAEETKARMEEVTAIKLQQQAEDVDFAIYTVTHEMDEIEGRAANGQAYHGDQTRLKQLERKLDVLLRRQGKVLERIEEEVQ